MNSNISISVEHLAKAYRLYHVPIDRLKEVVHPLRKKYFREFHALNDVNFEVRRGDTLGIIGRNGSGKSTLLKIIAGVLTPTSGNVEVNGKVSALLELGTGFNPELTGIENVYFSGTIMGFSKGEMDAKVDDILSFADIGKFIYQPVKTYSSGMFVRLAFAVAINVDPEILIIDEALSVGDMRFSMKCLRKMKDLIGRGTSAIFVSHDMVSVMNFCREVVWLHDGRIFQKGNPKRITTNYANFMTYGFLPPEMNRQEKAPDSDDDEYRPTSQLFDASAGGDSDPKLIEKLEKLNWTDLSSLPGIGEGGAVIRRIAICTAESGGSQVVFAGGEQCEVLLDLQTSCRLSSPIVCADFRDRKGNLIFGLNTYFVGPIMPEIGAGKRVVISFRFKMPLLLNGEYSIAVALADGSPESHVQHHIVNEALIVNLASMDAPRRHYMVSLESYDCAVHNLNSMNIPEGEHL